MNRDEKAVSLNMRRSAVAPEFFFDHFTQLEDGLFITDPADDLQPDGQPVIVFGDRDNEGRQSPGIGISDKRDIATISHAQREEFLKNFAVGGSGSMINRQDQQTAVKVCRHPGITRSDCLLDLPYLLRTCLLYTSCLKLYLNLS